MVRETAQAVCDGRIVDMVGSGYNPQVLPYAWLALVTGIAGLAMKLQDPIPLPPWLNEKVGMEEVKRTVKDVKSHLAPFWNCFRRS
jgi:acetoin utilization deacetylase AcuC-like enzyme